MNRLQRGHPSVQESVSGAERADDQFFEALRAADADALDGRLADDFVLVDVFAGAVADRDAFIASVASGLLAFSDVEVRERTARRYGEVAVIVGSTRMAGSFDDSRFEVASRYTHVLRRTDGGYWQLVNAQGTRIA